MRTTVYLGMSLDGFVARPDDGLDFLPDAPDGDDFGFSAFLATVDAIVMGRRTFDVVLGFGPARWPYGRTRLVVLSRTLVALPDGAPDTVELARGHPAEVLRRLAAEGVDHVYVDGALTARTFLVAGLVDVLNVTHVPVLIGDGIRLWGRLPGDVRLRLLDSRVLAGGLVRSVYAVARP